LKEYDKEQVMRSAVCYWKKQLPDGSGQQLGFWQLADELNNKKAFKSIVKELVRLCYQFDGKLN